MLKEDASILKKVSFGHFDASEKPRKIRRGHLRARRRQKAHAYDVFLRPFYGTKKLSQISDAVLQAIARSFIASYVDETVQYEDNL